MFEVFVALSKKHALKANAKSSIIFQYVLIGPILLIATITLALFKIYVSPLWDASWTLGFSLSITFSLLIIILSLRESAHLFSAHVKAEEEGTQNSLKLQQEIDALKLSAHHEREQTNQKLSALRAQLKASEKRADSFEELTSIKKYAWEALEDEKEALFQQMVTIQQDLDLFIAENQRLNEQLHTLRAQLSQAEALSLPPHPYNELRKQFEEKSAVLDATRRDLFAMEGKYLSVKKEMEEKLLEPQKDLQELLTQFDALETYCGSLEDDLTRHQELLTELSIKKTAHSKRKTPSKKIKVDEAVVADLFSDTPKKKAKTKAKT